MQYYIHEANMEKLTHKLAMIERKCKKYDCTFTFNITGEKYVEVEADNGCKYLQRYVIVDVEGVAKVNDWEFIGTLEHTECGNIIRQYKTDAEVPTEYRNRKPICEHCNSDRYRKDTYIIRNTVTGDYKQVGKTCLKSFTNGLSAEQVAQYLQYFTQLENMNDMGFEGGSCKRYEEIKQYLTAVIEVVDKLGFISKSKAESEEFYGCMPTVSTVNSCLHPYGKYDREIIEQIDFKGNIEENKQKVEVILEWIKGLNAKTLNGSQYIYNLYITAHKQYLEYRDLGLITSLPSAYYKHINDIKEKEKQEQAKEGSKYVGEIKDKLQFEYKDAKIISSYETEYGRQYICQFLDENDNVFIWKTGNGYIFNEDGKVNGTIKGTVKAHNAFNGVLQTELTRCKVL